MVVGGGDRGVAVVGTGWRGSWYAPCPRTVMNSAPRSCVRGSCQDGEMKPANERHSPTVECRVRESSEQRNNASDRGALTHGRARSEGQRNRASRQGALSPCRVQSKEVVMTGKFSQWVRGTRTHTAERRARVSSGRQNKALSSAEQGSCQDIKRKLASEGHSPPDSISLP
jgi:hypothetical protein